MHSKTTWEIFTTEKITQLLQFLKKLKRFNCALAKFMEVHAFVTALKFSKHQGHQELSGESDENNPLKPNQSAPSIYIMIEICYFSLDQ